MGTRGDLSLARRQCWAITGMGFNGKGIEGSWPIHFQDLSSLGFAK